MLRLSRAHGISIVAATRSSSRDSKKERDCSLSEISQRNESQDCSSTAVQMRNASTSGGSEAVVNNDVEPDASCAQSPDPAQSTNPPHDAEKGNTSKFEVRCVIFTLHASYVLHPDVLLKLLRQH